MSAATCDPQPECRADQIAQTHRRGGRDRRMRYHMIVSEKKLLRAIDGPTTTGPSPKYTQHWERSYAYEN